MNKKKKSTNISPYPDDVIDRLARAFYPAILACWNSEEGQRSLVGARPLHLACARPFGRLKAPLGLSLLRCTAQMRACRVAGGTGSSYPQQRKTERSRRGTPCCTYRYRMWILAGCVFRVTSGKDFILAHIDAKLIVQVIINLVDNAIKYTPVGSVIEIHTDQKEQWVTVSVSDNGPGIPDEQKPRIFDMFYSGANKVVDSRRSLGLGLSLCKSIVTAHGGTISVSDNQPNGTVFTFTLPAGKVELHE